MAIELLNLLTFKKNLHVKILPLLKQSGDHGLIWHKQIVE